MLRQRIGGANVRTSSERIARRSAAEESCCALKMRIPWKSSWLYRTNWGN